MQTEYKELSQTMLPDDQDTNNLPVVKQQSLNEESLALIDQIISEKDEQKARDLTYLFNANQNKKTMVRVNKLSDLLDTITDQALARFTARPDEISNKELDAYKNYCMKLYNFKEISPSTLTTLSAAMKKCLYIFQDRTFVKIDSSEIELYANLITIYGPQWPTVYTDKEIQDSWELYLTAKATLDDQLSSYLES